MKVPGAPLKAITRTGLCKRRWDLLLKFGGHPMAAGFSLKEENVGEFRRRLNEQSTLTREDFIPKIWIDGHALRVHIRGVG